MQGALTWATEYWWLISLALLFVGSVLNSITEHYGAAHPRIVPLFRVILEAISLLVSKGATNGRWGKLKLPLQDVPPKNAGGSSGVSP